jgi:hypothetical protein
MWTRSSTPWPPCSMACSGWRRFRSQFASFARSTSGCCRGARTAPGTGYAAHEPELDRTGGMYTARGVVRAATAARGRAAAG